MCIQGVIIIIKKKYINENEIINALESLKSIYEKSVENIIKTNSNSFYDRIENLKLKIEMIDKVIIFVKQLKLKPVNSFCTYNLRVKEIDNKYYHTVTLEKINNEGENEILEEYVTNIENI